MARNRIFLVLAATLAAGPLAAQDAHDWGVRNSDYAPFYDAQFRAPVEVSDVSLETRVLASGLEHPWAVAALPQGRGFLVTERPGRLRHLSAEGTVSEPIAGVPEVENRPQRTGGTPQAGLLDVKLGPDFAETRMVYLTYAKPVGDGLSATAAARGRLSEDLKRLEEVEDIWMQQPASPVRMHYGSRIVFDGAGHAFVTTGEHFGMEERELAQDLDTGHGKIVRIGLDGAIPDSNPFTGRDDARDAIWSYGHRNVQGAAMIGEHLWVIEHGPAGGDELNLVLPARNYGWPVVSYGMRYSGPAIGSGEPRQPGFEEPIYFWDPVIAPGDMAEHAGEQFAAWNGDLLIAGLVAPGIVRLELQGPLVTAEERILTDYGRVRDVEVLSDGSFLVATDYADGQIVHVTEGEG
ncbi:PQQ-dependent sugar dehydrogenase [Rhodosalinus halophilus]|uniref:PQQ-dependent sugar dehydrogenase n=1 Tax=Rhodosalinus halophilus TaxID=2259333 RepID=A0A365U3M1_9RHOB|nr:PQQ-dependent sugar dehydrogenase [Rhodosalinus halophilus]RBI82582.1 PQQ-dependent sugar dehydrogenase [Rhodosalinus halophilus]